MRNWQCILLVVLVLLGIAMAGQANFQLSQRDKIAPPMLPEAANSSPQGHWM